MDVKEAGRKGGNANTPDQQRARVENGKKSKGRTKGSKNKGKRDAKA